ncbi:hypothetical protein [Streptomyces zingiberis]|uniref:Uncharacterized protein n=1 Tax=Streptomyces zingiberis TaxID=2053010 RepID=A0ABX1BQ72_9ACTN|nr:hypothetical protein [Streptomyces zingiberis]NJP99879.1 hypothetical protein [Streptomyces zingiberis]
MEALWTSVVAVVGTLLGSLITHVFQRLASRRSEQFTRSESLRQERIAAYSTFAAAMEDYRRGQADRWFRWAEDPEGEAFLTARDEAHHLRTMARQTLYRVKLLTDAEDQDVIRAAERAYDHTRDISLAVERAERDTRDLASKRAIEAFVARASPLVR